MAVANSVKSKSYSNEKQILILTMNGDYQEWRRLGMECIDKGMYQIWINKNEAEIEVLKEKI